MKKEEFITKLHDLLSALDDKVTASWIDWTVDIGSSEDTESYLRDLYDAFYSVHQKYGGELTQTIYTTIPQYVIMYPYEFMPVAELLSKGHSMDIIAERIEGNEFLNGNIPDLAGNECDEQTESEIPELTFRG